MSLSSATDSVRYTGDGATSVYSYTFRVNDSSDLRVIKITNAVTPVVSVLTLTTDYTVTGVGISTGGTITLVAGSLTTGYTLVIRRKQSLIQETEIRNEGTYFASTHENKFDQLTMIDQQQQYEVNRSLRMPEHVSTSAFSMEMPNSPVGIISSAPITNASGTGWADTSLWPTSTAISTASANAVAAAASASAAAASQTAASVSETAAASSAASAASAVASAFFRDVVFFTSASSPITIDSSHNGKLLVFDSSGGAIAVTLPQISTLTPPFNVAALCSLAGNNITFTRSGTDTFTGGGTTKVLSIINTGLQLTSDTDPSPDVWSVIDFGTAADGSITAIKIASDAVTTVKILDANVTTAKLAAGVVSGMTAVTPALDDYVAIADTSDSSNVKKALISGIKASKTRSVTTTDAPSNTADETLRLSGASFTVTLPTAVGFDGKRFRLLHLGTSLTQIYSLATTSSQTIGGVASGSYALYTNGEVLEIESDGANWQILNHKAETDWIDAGTITITATTTGPSKGATDADKIRWRRVGRDAIINYAYRQTGTSGAAGTGDYLFAIPSNMTIDTTYITAYTTVLGNATQWKPTNVVGYGIGSGSTDAGHYTVSVYDTSKVRSFFVSSTGQSVICAASNQNTNIANVSYNWEIRVPITGWRQ